jgi:hypothetical protein
MINTLSRTTFTDDKAVQELQQFINQTVQAMIMDGILNGRDVDLTFSGAGTQVIQHNLNRPIKAALVLANSTGTAVSTDAINGSSTSVSITTAGAALLRVRLF